MDFRITSVAFYNYLVILYNLTLKRTWIRKQICKFSEDHYVLVNPARVSISLVLSYWFPVNFGCEGNKSISWIIVTPIRFCRKMEQCRNKLSSSDNLVYYLFFCIDDVLSSDFRQTSCIGSNGILLLKTSWYIQRYKITAETIKTGIT